MAFILYLYIRHSLGVEEESIPLQNVHKWNLDIHFIL